MCVTSCTYVYVNSVCIYAFFHLIDLICNKKDLESILTMRLNGIHAEFQSGLLYPDLHNHGKAPDACDPHFFIGKRGVKINAKGVCVYN